jgi:hypothetical protein
MLTVMPFLAGLEFLNFGCSLNGGFLIVKGRALIIMSFPLLPLLDSFWFCSLSFEESGIGMVGSAASVFWLKPASLFTDCRGGVYKLKKKNNN